MYSCYCEFQVTFFRADLPDLVPDVYQFQRSLVNTPYLSRVPMYYLTCALEEECLSSSARGQPYNHYRYGMLWSYLQA